MAWLTSHLKTLFASKKPKNPPKRKPPTREEKGKFRATDDGDDNTTTTTTSPNYNTQSSPRRSDSNNSSNTNSSDLTDSDLLPILHYEELYLVPQILTQFPAFYLVGHPLPPPPLPQAKQILTSPDPVKQTLIHPRKSTVRGYNHAKSSGREWWDYTPDNGGTMLTIPDEEFQRSTREYFEKSIELLQKICREFNNNAATEGGERRIVVPEEVMSGIGFSTMRYLRYSPTILERPNIPKTEPAVASSSSSSHSASSSKPQQREDGYSLPRMEAHTDHGILTLMTATEPSGLYVWDRNGKMFSAPPIENTVMVIAGDLMTHFTAMEGKNVIHDGKEAVGEGTVLPAVHAVVLPKGDVERYSIAVFLRPKKDLVIGKQRVAKEDGEVVEEDMTFARWAEEKGKIKGRRCWMIGQEGLSGGQDI